MKKSVRTLVLALEGWRARRRGYLVRHGYKFSFTHPRMTDRLRRALLRVSYEASEIDLIRGNVTPQDRVLEIGICLGATSLILSSIVGDDHLRLYEADPRNLALAQENFALNGKRLDMRNQILIAGGDRPDTVRFFSSDNPSSSSVYARGGDETEFEIATDSLETVIADFRPTVLCADIEGAEIDLLGKCRDFGTLQKILLETHERITGRAALDGMIAHLQAAGFVARDGHDDGFLVMYRPAAG